MNCTRLFRSISLLLLLAFCSSLLAAEPESSPTPTLYLIGDSTVRCGSGNGGNGMWGWGSVIDSHFDTTKIHIENKAMGGRSSRTFLTEGRWQEVLDKLQPGDFVLMQFGHNDGGEMFTGTRPRASIKGNGEETREGVVEATGKAETVHSYGWYIRKYASEAKERGATPIVLSLIPRERWSNGQVIRASNDYAKWAAEAAEQVGVDFVDLNDIAAARFEQDGQTLVHAAYFTPIDHTHTSWQGAEVNAACVVAGIRGLADSALKSYLLDEVGEPAVDKPAMVRRFDFGEGEVARGYWPVDSTMNYSAERGYGFETLEGVTVGKQDDSSVAGDWCASDAPLLFSIAVPEGNYEVKVILPAGHDSVTTVKAELRRLMIEQSTDGELVFTVNVRNAQLPGGDRVRLKEREKTKEAWAWDDKLTLEINGPHPAVAAIEVKAVNDRPTVFLTGDSTVTDQPLEPWAGWGQMLPRFFAPSVVVSNQAESGETVRGSLSARRFAKVFAMAKPGDYLFIQFGHNDQKSKSRTALQDYRDGLKQVISQAQQQGVVPVLVTSMERQRGLTSETLGEYPEAMRELAEEMGIALIDLNAMSKQLYAGMGDSLDAAFVDGTHHTNYGSYQLAQCVVVGIKELVPSLAKHLRRDIPPFDIDSPPASDDFHLPASPQRDPALTK